MNISIRNLHPKVDDIWAMLTENDELFQSATFIRRLTRQDSSLSRTSLIFQSATFIRRLTFLRLQIVVVILFQSATFIRRLTANIHNFRMSICFNITKIIYSNNRQFYFFFSISILSQNIPEISGANLLAFLCVQDIRTCLKQKKHSVASAVFIVFWILFSSSFIVFLFRGLCYAPILLLYFVLFK